MKPLYKNDWYKIGTAALLERVFVDSKGEKANAGGGGRTSQHSNNSPKYLKTKASKIPETPDGTTSGTNLVQGVKPCRPWGWQNRAQVQRGIFGRLRGRLRGKGARGGHSAWNRLWASARLILLGLLIAPVVAPQDTAAELQALSALAGRLAVDVQRQNSAGWKFGHGLEVVDDSLVRVNDAWVAVRGPVPQRPGLCDQGTGTWSTSATHLYLCIPDGTGRGFRWGRVALQVSW